MSHSMQQEYPWFHRLLRSMQRESSVLGVSEKENSRVLNFSLSELRIPPSAVKEQLVHTAQTRFLIYGVGHLHTFRFIQQHREVRIVRTGLVDRHKRFE